MMHFEKVFKNRRLTPALIGLSPEEFGKILPTFTDVLIKEMKQRHYGNPDQQRKFGGGKKGFLKTAAEKLSWLFAIYRGHPHGRGERRTSHRHSGAASTPLETPFLTGSRIRGRHAKKPEAEPNFDPGLSQDDG